MWGSLLQMVMLVGTTHLVRALGRWVGPRRGGLLMGVPSTTAMALLGFGINDGMAGATAAAELCLAGLVAASALPLAYAWAASAGWPWPRATAAAVAAYAVIASALWWLPATGAGGCVGVAMVGVACACQLARRLVPDVEEDEQAARTASHQGVGRASRACRIAMPVAYVSVLQTLRALAGPSVSGRFITFPGASLAVLVTSHLESGPAHTCRLASGMPFGGLGMLAFLTAFRVGGPRLGLAGGLAVGYVAALAVLAVLGRPSARSRSVLVLLSTRRKALMRRAARRVVRGTATTNLVVRALPRRRFAPRPRAGSRLEAPRRWRGPGERGGYSPRCELLAG